MEFGAITGYVDLAQILLYAFWLFFAGLIYYLCRESHREGYPMEVDGLNTVAKGWPVPPPKTFKTLHGDVVVPDPSKGEPAYAGTSTDRSPGSPIDPAGDPMTAGVGAGAWANRADVPDPMLDGTAKIVPLRVVKDFGVSPNDDDPRGLPVVGGDGKTAGKVKDLWVDQSEMMFRFIEVELDGGKGVRLLPVPFARIRSDRVDVNSIFAGHFAGVPTTRHPEQVTLMEEERIAAYYGAGTLYAEPSRGEPLI
ncbi:MAG: photosynthetic reaction center subunit H [Rubrivivax sp.]|jgi:photosynthetic reaction center H subunit